MLLVPAAQHFAFCPAKGIDSAYRTNAQSPTRWGRWGSISDRPLVCSLATLLSLHDALETSSFEAAAVPVTTRSRALPSPCAK